MSQSDSLCFSFVKKKLGIGKLLSKSEKANIVVAQ